MHARLRGMLLIGIAAVATLALAETAKLPYQWESVAIGGGGYVTGLAIHPTVPDLVYFRTDVGGCYRLDPKGHRWVPLWDWVRMGRDGNLLGIESIALAPSNPDLVFVTAGLWPDRGSTGTFKSADRGATWTKVNDNAVQGNGTLRWDGERLAVDPANESIVYYGSRWGGLLRSTEGGARGTWKGGGVGGLVAGRGVNVVAFDPATVKAGKTQIIYASVFAYAGNAKGGIYRTTDAGATWALMPGSPTALRMAVAGDGAVWVAGDKGVFRYINDTWTTVTPKSDLDKGYCAITVDPKDPKHAVCIQYLMGPGAPLFRTTDAGATWRKVTIDFQPEMAWRPRFGFAAAVADLQFDPFHPGKVWMADWYNVLYTEDIAATPCKWTTLGLGHEETVAANLVCPPKGAPLFTGVADVQGFRHENLTTFPPSVLYPSRWAAITGLAFCEADPDAMVAVGGQYSEWGGDGGGVIVSKDNGRTWEACPKLPLVLVKDGKVEKTWQVTVQAGNVRMSATNPKHIVLAPGWNKYNEAVKEATAAGLFPPNILVSEDFGQTWKPGDLPGGVATLGRYGGNMVFDNDKVDGNVFYALSKDPEANANVNGVYRSDDGGHTWKVVNNTQLRTFVWRKQLKAAPMLKGDVWFGNETGLFRSKDAGVTFTRLNGVDTAWNFAFGKEAPGATVPALYVFGTVNKVEGIFRSDDLGETWERINDDQRMYGGISNPSCMDADRQTFGRVYLGLGGRGFVYGQPAPKAE